MAPEYPGWQMVCKFGSRKPSNPTTGTTQLLAENLAQSYQTRMTLERLLATMSVLVLELNAQTRGQLQGQIEKISHPTQSVAMILTRLWTWTCIKNRTAFGNDRNARAIACFGCKAITAISRWTPAFFNWIAQYMWRAFCCQSGYVELTVALHHVFHSPGGRSHLGRGSSSLST